VADSVIRYVTRDGANTSTSLSPDTKVIDLSSKRIVSVDLSPVGRLGSLQTLDLSHNLLEEVDLWPLITCKELSRLSLIVNPLRSIDASPLFFCPNLTNLDVDAVVVVVADQELGARRNRPRPLDEMRLRRRLRWLIGHDDMDPLVVIEKIKNALFVELLESHKGPERIELIQDSLTKEMSQYVERTLVDEMAEAKQAGQYKKLYVLQRGLELIRGETRPYS